jgi:hypothetical protein
MPRQGNREFEEAAPPAQVDSGWKLSQPSMNDMTRQGYILIILR